MNEERMYEIRLQIENFLNECEEEKTKAGKLVYSVLDEALSKLGKINVGNDADNMSSYELRTTTTKEKLNALVEEHGIRQIIGCISSICYQKSESNDDSGNWLKIAKQLNRIG